MGRKKTPINPIRGKRLRLLLDKRGMTQEELAERIGYSKEHISYIINGRRNLTPDTAETIAEIFKPVQVEWLLGFSDYMTASDQLAQVVNDLDAETTLLHTGVFSLATLAGYTIELNSLSNSASLSDFFEKMHHSYKISSGDNLITLSLAEMNLFENEIFEFVDLKFKHLFKQKELISNGKPTGTP